jgi:O-antigen ligase
VAAYLAAVLLGVVQAVALGDPGRTARAALPFAVAGLVVVVVRAIGPRDDASLVVWLHGVAVAGVLLAVWLSGAFLGALPAGIGEPAGFYRVKVAVTSPVGDHNTAAGLLLPAIVASAAMGVRNVRWYWGLAATSLGLVATMSRGGVLALLAVAVAGWFLARNRRFRLLLLASGIVSVLLVLALAVVLDASPPADAELDQRGGLGASVVGRIDLVQRGLEVGSSRPLLGAGMGGFAEEAADLPQPNDHAHQLFVHAFAEGGMVLLAVAMAIPVALAVRVQRLPAGPGREVLALAGLGLILHAQMEILGGRIGYEVLMALLVGLAGALDASRGYEPGARSA